MTRLNSFNISETAMGGFLEPSSPCPTPRDRQGKSTLCRDLFGASPQLTWRDAPVLAHFSSLDVATEFLGAAGLDLPTAMRPYHELSGGEQARAHMARALSLNAQVLVLDEFTSLVDRATAKRMARGLQSLVRRRRVEKVVVVSSHSDFVARPAVSPPSDSLIGGPCWSPIGSTRPTTIAGALESLRNK